ncbi:hypothetical protein C8Q79DRAFT_1003403 [Trametes meyenii]|nr:hypothetical protein C8Q79DRAFT_1003403 [Trametes meyenii]
MALYDLPVDILLDIFGLLSVCDIIHVRQTCKSLEAVTRQRTVWHEALSRHAARSCLPIPMLVEHNASDSSATQLERQTIRAIRFWRNWLSHRPAAYRHTAIRPARPAARNRTLRNLGVMFLPHVPDHVLTLTLYDDTVQDRRFSFELWDFRPAQYGAEPRCVDILQIEALLAYAMNVVSGSTVALAITRRDPITQQCITEAYGIDSLHSDCNPHFKLLTGFPGYRNTIGLHGAYLVATDAEQDVRIINVEEGRLEYTLKAPLMLNDPTLRFAERQCMDAVVLDNFVISFCKQYIFLYHVPPTATSHTSQEPADIVQEASNIDAIATYKWRWRIDSLIARPRRAPPTLNLHRKRTHNTTSAPPLIDILIRFDTWFPWPVNILHHFALAPNPAYTPAAFTPSDLSTYPYLLSDTDGPFMVHSIPSPLRIFTPSDMALGTYGTAVWLDAAADATTPAQAGDRGQRVAGRVLTRTPVPLPAARTRPGEGPQDDHVSPGLGDPAALNAGATAETVELATGAIPAGRGSTVVSVFDVQETEERWNRVAVDEESGRVAVGHVDGTVSIYTYVPAW